MIRSRIRGSTLAVVGGGSIVVGVDCAVLFYRMVSGRCCSFVANMIRVGNRAS